MATAHTLFPRDLCPANAVLSLHARRRAQARGVSQRTIRLILANADRVVAVGSNCRSFMVSHRLLRDRRCDIAPAERDRLDGVAVIWSEVTDEIVTVLHTFGRIGRRYRRAR